MIITQKSLVNNYVIFIICICLLIIFEIWFIENIYLTGAINIFIVIVVYTLINIKKGLYLFILLLPIAGFGNFKVLPVLSPLRIFALLIVFSFFSNTLLKRKRIYIPHKQLFTIVILFITLSYFWVLDKELFFQSYAGFLLLIGFFIVCINIFKLKDINKIFLMLIIVSTVQSTYGIYQCLSGKKFFNFSFLSGAELTKYYRGGNFLRATGTFIDPNYYAYFLLVILPFIFYFLINEKNIKQKIIFSVILLINIIGIAVSSSRMGIIALILTLIFFFIIAIKKKNISMIFVFLILLTLSKAFFKEYTLFVRFKGIIPTETARYQILYYFFKDAIANFLLLGGGWGNFGTIMEGTGWGMASAAHNEYIQMLGEVGIFGVILILLFIFMALHQYKITRQVLRKYKTPENKRIETWFIYLNFSFFLILFCAFFLSIRYTKIPYIVISLYYIIFRNVRYKYQERILTNSRKMI